MALPKNITKEHLLKAIEKIEIDGIPNEADSQYYDVVYKGKKYPPKVIVSYANIFANDSELNRNTFAGGIGTPCFKLLEENGFEISKKKMSYYNELIKFLKVSDEQAIGEGTVGVQSYNRERIKIYNGLKVEAKFGTGRASAIPWIAFLNEYDSVQNGIYPAYLYYKEKNILILSYGKSESNPPNRSWDIKNKKTIKEYFSENNLGKPEKYGESLVFKVYDLKADLIEKNVDDDLNSILSKYLSIESNIIQKQAESPKNISTIDMTITQIAFDLNAFHLTVGEAGLIFSPQLIRRFISSLITKPVLVLTGLSGSGKTKLAQAFVQWISQDKNQYKIVPVGADWTNREPLLGYPNALRPEEYVKPDSGVLDLILNALSNPDLPYFLILDEMNLSHVERYFADFLSVMESKEEILLHSSGLLIKNVPEKIKIPLNLFIIGTVNIDETTNMFSPKVLDRANTIEFRISQEDMSKFLETKVELNLELLNAKGSEMSKNFLELTLNKSFANEESVTINKILIQFFNELKPLGAEFGFRGATEMIRLINQLSTLEDGLTIQAKLDIAIVQKLLPKLHGSRKKLAGPLEVLAGLCLKRKEVSALKEQDKTKKIYQQFIADNRIVPDWEIIYPISFEKIERMLKNAIENGFTSFAEA